MERLFLEVLFIQTATKKEEEEVNWYSFGKTDKNGKNEWYKYKHT